MGTFTSVSLYDRGSTRPVSGRTVRVTSWPDGGPVATDPDVLTTDYYGATPEFSTVDPDVHAVRITAAAAQPRTVWSVETAQAVADAGPFLADADARLSELESRSGTSVTHLAGDVPTAENLPDTGIEGETYIAQDTMHLWVWSDSQGQYLDFGTVQGPPGADGSDAQVTDANVASAIGSSTFAELDARYPLAVQTVPYSRVEQVDYAAALASRAPYTSLGVRRVQSNGTLEISALAPDGNHVTHELTGSAPNSGRDDYRILGRIWTGGPAPVNYTYNDVTKTGAYTATADQFAYTTEVGATWTRSVTVPFKGAVVRVKDYFRDNRGGRWQVTLAGRTTILNTWSAAAGADEVGVAVSPVDIGPGVYTVTAEFLGADPSNPPAGGVPARGWLSRTPGTLTSFQNLVTLPGASPDKAVTVGPASNREFALWVRPVGGTSYAWIPHHGVESAFEAEPPRLIIDGVHTSFDSLPLGGGYTPALATVQLVQHVYGRHAETGSTNVVEIWTTHTFHPDGRASVTGRIKFLQAMQVQNGFTIMAPVTQALFTDVISSHGRSYPNGAAQVGTNTFVPEDDKAFSWLFLSSTDQQVAHAVTFRNPAETLRQGQADKPAAGAMTWVEHRSAGDITKLYPKLWATHTVIPAGTSVRFGADYATVSTPGTYGELAL